MPSTSGACAHGRAGSRAPTERWGLLAAEQCRDRRKLTFYFLADNRIDFREVVRELFKVYKTRIWMCALQDPNLEIGRQRTDDLLPKIDEHQRA